MNILVTGGKGDIGKAIVDEFIYRGHQVFSPSRKELDLNSKSSIESYFKNENNINIFVHCAGINNPVPFLDLDEHSLEKTLNINTLSCIKIVKCILPSMIENQFGRIINISSLWSFLSSPKRTAYSTSKAALDAFTRNLAVEFGSSNILVNSILPGFVNTKLTRKNLSDARIDEIIEDTPIHRLIDVSDVAKIAYFLGSDKNDVITGQSIVVDGGYSICR